MRFFFQGTHNVAGHFLRMHQHEIVFAVVQEPGGYESWTDICKPDGKFLDVSQLLQRIDVRVLETFGGRIGRSSSQPLVPAMELMTARCPPFCWAK